MNFRRSLKTIQFKLKKNSPRIKTYTGCAGTIIGAGWACYQTTKLPALLDDIKADITTLKAGEYTSKDLTLAYLKGAGRVGKLYAGPAAVEAGSVGLILSGDKEWGKREASAAAAAATYSTILKNYRKNVVDELGEDADRRFRYGLKEEEFVESDENGKETVTKNTVVTNPVNEVSDFSRFFDESCAGWDKDPEYNLMFLNGVQSWATNKLRADGYLFLNQVYEALGMQPSYAGNYVGWIYDDNNPVGDNQVLFNIYDYKDESKRNFVNGYTNVVLIDFNIDGDLMHNPVLSERLAECFPDQFLKGYNRKDNRKLTKYTWHV